MGKARVIKAGDGFIIKLVDDWLRVPTKKLDELAGKAIRSEDDLIKALKKNPDMLDGIKRKASRDTFMGPTPNAWSGTGKDVMDRMARQERILDANGKVLSPEEAAKINKNNAKNYQFIDKDGNTWPFYRENPQTGKMEGVNMGHKEGTGYLDADGNPIDKEYHSAVEHWKNGGYKDTPQDNYDYMHDPDNYEFEWGPENQARGRETGKQHNYLDVEPYPGQGTEADIPGLGD